MEENWMVDMDCLVSEMEKIKRAMIESFAKSLLEKSGVTEEKIFKDFIKAGVSYTQIGYVACSADDEVKEFKKLFAEALGIDEE